MSRKNRPHPESAGEASAVDLAKPEETPAFAPAPPEDELSAARREVAELRDKNLRLLAEAQNQQKRAERERQELRRFAEFELARELLVLIDDLERTADAARAIPQGQAIADGMRIVSEHFQKILRDHGIAPIEAVGRPFDPSFHEALLQQPSDQHPAGIVLQELARGYTMHERVLRPSRVAVSSGSVQPASGAPAGRNDQEP
jgi:molecular chaperone GrpE